MLQVGLKIVRQMMEWSEREAVIPELYYGMKVELRDDSEKCG
jgi:hypothetical protein